MQWVFETPNTSFPILNAEYCLQKHKKRAADLNLASSRQRNVSDFFLDMGEVSEEEDGEPLLNIE